MIRSYGTYVCLREVAEEKVTSTGIYMPGADKSYEVVDADGILPGTKVIVAKGEDFKHREFIPGTGEIIFVDKTAILGYIGQKE